MNPQLKKWLNPYIVALSFLIVGLYLFTRLYQLTLIPVFVDEAIYIRWSQIMKNEPSLRFLPLSDGKQPLFMWLTMPSFKLFSDPLMAGRFISVLAGLGTLVGIGTLIWIATGSVIVSLSASLVYVFTPYTLFFDRMALVDSLLAMFGVWSFILGLTLVKKPRLDLAMVLGYVLGAALLTKSPAVFFIYLQPFLLLTALPNNKKQFIKLVICWVVSFVVAYVMYNILRLGPNFHLVNSRNQDYLFSFSEVLTHPFNPLVGNLKRTFEWSYSLLTWPVFIAALLGIINKKTRLLSISLWAWILVPTLAQSAIAKVYTSRYWLYVTPFIVTQVGLFLHFLETKNKRLLAVYLAFIISSSLVVVYPLYSKPDQANFPQEMEHGYFQEWTAGYGQKEIAEYLKNLPSDQKIFVGTEGFFGSLPDGLQIYTQDLPNVNVIGVGWPIGDIKESLTNSLADNTVFLVVNESRMQLTPTDQQRLKLIARYPKPARPDGTAEALLFYQVLR